MPELRQLRAYVVLAEELNFTRAAARVYVTQPALSHQIGRLERDLGLTLLRRTSRRVTLTPDGERFLSLCRAVLNTLDDGLRALRADAAPHMLRVGFSDYVTHTVIPEWLTRLRASVPGLALRQIEGSSEEQLRGLQDGLLDVGFFVAPQVRVPGVAQRRLWTEELVLALPERHPLTALDRVPVTALDGQRVLLNSAESNPQMYRYLQHLFAGAGVTPVQVVNAGARMYSFAGIMHLIAEGEGLFLIVSAWQGAGHPGVTFRPLEQPTPGLPFRMVWRTTLPEDMQDALKRAFPSGR